MSRRFLSGLLLTSVDYQLLSLPEELPKGMDQETNLVVKGRATGSPLIILLMPLLASHGISGQFSLKETVCVIEKTHQHDRRSFFPCY